MIILLDDNEKEELKAIGVDAFITQNQTAIATVLQDIEDDLDALQMVQDMKDNPNLKQTYTQAVSALQAAIDSTEEDTKLVDDNATIKP